MRPSSRSCSTKTARVPCSTAVVQCHGSMEGSTKTAWLYCTRAAVLWNGSTEGMRKLPSQERRELTPITEGMRKGVRHSMYEGGHRPQSVVNLV